MSERRFYNVTQKILSANSDENACHFRQITFSLGRAGAGDRTSLALRSLRAPERRANETVAHITSRRLAGVVRLASDASRGKLNSEIRARVFEEARHANEQNGGGAAPAALGSDSVSSVHLILRPGCVARASSVIPSSKKQKRRCQCGVQKPEGSAPSTTIRLPKTAAAGVRFT